MLGKFNNVFKLKNKKSQKKYEFRTGNVIIIK